MVTEVSYEYVKQHSGFRRGFSLSFPPGASEDLLFEISGDQQSRLAGHEDLCAYLEEIQRQSLPLGLYKIATLDNIRFFRIIADKKARAVAREFAQTLFD